MFPSGSGRASTTKECGSGDLMSRANRLLTELRSNPDAVTTKISRKRKKVLKSREYQRNMVVVDFPGHKAPDLQILHEYDKVFQGPLCFSDSMSEEDVRDEKLLTSSPRRNHFFMTSSSSVQMTLRLSVV